MEVGQTFDYQVKVKNTGGADGTWTETLSAKIGDSSWGKVDDIKMDVPAGETKTWKSDKGDIPYQTVVTYRLENAQKEFKVQAVSASLNYGEGFKAPNGMAVTVKDVEMKSYYEYKGYDGSTKEKRASDDKQWAFVQLRSKNKGDEPVFAPMKSDISIIVDNRQFDYKIINKEDGIYEGNEISPGIVREGWIAYEVPSNLSKSDIEVAWTGEDFNGSWTVRWSSA